MKFMLKMTYQGNDIPGISDGKMVIQLRNKALRAEMVNFVSDHALHSAERVVRRDIRNV